MKIENKYNYAASYAWWEQNWWIFRFRFWLNLPFESGELRAISSRASPTNSNTYNAFPRILYVCSKKLRPSFNNINATRTYKIHPGFIYVIFGILSNVTSNHICCVLHGNNDSLDGVNVVFVSLCSEVCAVVFFLLNELFSIRRNVYINKGNIVVQVAGCFASFAHTEFPPTMTLLPVVASTMKPNYTKLSLFQPSLPWTLYPERGKGKRRLKFRLTKLVHL